MVIADFACGDLFGSKFIPWDGWVGGGWVVGWVDGWWVVGAVGGWGGVGEQGNMKGT